MLAPSGFSLTHVILVVFATPGESQAPEIAQLNFGRALRCLIQHTGSQSAHIIVQTSLPDRSFMLMKY